MKKARNLWEYNHRINASKSFSAQGKIILSGEYAVVFGYPGVAVPAHYGVTVAWEETNDTPMKIVLEGAAGVEAYARKIIDLCAASGGPKTGTVTIKNEIPLGKGMGSSTALVIALSKCLLGPERKEEAILIEDTVNPGHSGLDFAVIWSELPMTFKRGSKPLPARMNLGFLQKSELIDTGMPNETTPELVAWMTLRSAQGDKDVAAALKTIGDCTERLLSGESPLTVFPDHHRAQVALGVVPDTAQKIISEIEAKGRAAKVLGAGGRTGGGGMVLVI